MSRAYRVRLAESMARVVAVSDGIEAYLELLPLLAHARMAELLGAELARAGFLVDGGRAVRGPVEVLLDTGRVTLRLDTREEVTATGETTVSTPAPSRPAAEEEARSRLRAELEQALAAREAETRAAATEQLVTMAEALRDELDGVVTRVTSVALRERAAQLGEVESVTEDPTTGELVIKVKV